MLAALLPLLAISRVNATEGTKGLANRVIRLRAAARLILALLLRPNCAMSTPGVSTQVQTSTSVHARLGSQVMVPQLARLSTTANRVHIHARSILDAI